MTILTIIPFIFNVTTASSNVDLYPYACRILARDVERYFVSVDTNNYGFVDFTITYTMYTQYTYSQDEGVTNYYIEISNINIIGDLYIYNGQDTDYHYNLGGSSIQFNNNQLAQTITKSGNDYTTNRRLALELTGITNNSFVWVARSGNTLTTNIGSLTRNFTLSENHTLSLQGPDIKLEIDSLFYQRIVNNLNNAPTYGDGYGVGYDVGRLDGYQEGYTDGYNVGFNGDSTAFTIFSGILNIAMVPINFFISIFNFEILGINLSSFVTALLSVMVVIIVIRTITGKKEE